MRAPIFLATRADILGVLFVVIVAVIAVFAMVTYPALFWQRGMRGDFGSDWDCQYVPKGGPVCVKKVPRAPAN
jgi:hypothetical protein